MSNITRTKGRCLLCLCFVVIMVIFLSACGGKDSSSSNTQPKDSQTSDDKSSVVEVDTSTVPETEITLKDFDSFDGATRSQLTSRFGEANESADDYINFTNISYMGYPGSLKFFFDGEFMNCASWTSDIGSEEIYNEILSDLRKSGTDGAIEHPKDGQVEQTVRLNERNYIAGYEDSDSGKYTYLFTRYTPVHNLDGLKVNAALDFANGICWLKFDGRFAAVNTEGKELFAVYSGQILYASPFENDQAFVAYKNDSGNIVEDIYDKDGNVLYSTAWLDTSADITEEHIIAQGNDEFLVMRHESGLRADQWLIGTINSSGETINEFRTYEYNADGGYVIAVDGHSLPAWMDTSNFAGGAELPLNYEVCRLGSYGGTLQKIGELPQYLGEGIYYLPGQSLLLRPKDGHLIRMNGGHGAALGKAENGMVLVNSGGGAYYADDINSEEVVEHYLPFYSKSISPSFMPSSGFADGLFFYDHNYYDINGNIALELPEFDEFKIFCTEFYGDYALVVIEGADDNYYVTVIDKSGRQQFEPFMTKQVSLNMDNGHFASYADNKWTIYDHNGNSVKEVAGVKGGYADTYCLFSDGFARFVQSQEQIIYTFGD